MKRGAIFDMDGTLLDTERLFRNAWIELAEEYGQTPNPEFPRAVCGSNGKRMMEIIHTYYPAVDAKQFMESCYARVEQKLETSVPPKPGMEEILSYLHEQGVKLAVASSSKRAQVEKNLRLAGVLHYFDTIVGGDEVTNSKPAPDIVLLAAQRMGCAPQDCYMFEDGANGIHAGVAAGCATIMIPDLTPPTEKLRSVCAAVYESLSAARKAIENGEI